MAVDPKPKFLSGEYGRQFEDRALAAVYRKRPPYPAEVFEIIARRLPANNQTLLELGAGTGEVAIPMADLAAEVHAVEPSIAMIDIARTIPGFERVTWINSSAEAFGYPQKYGTIVCAQCLGWMDWEVVFPAMVRALDPNGLLVICELRDTLIDEDVQGQLTALISRYSTNQDFLPFDLIQGLQERGLFETVGSASADPITFEQSIDDYIDSIHARNGFSRDRMAPAAAAAFDAKVGTLLHARYPDGLRGEIKSSIIWGKPLYGA